MYLLSKLIIVALLYFCKIYTFPASLPPAIQNKMQEEPISMEKDDFIARTTATNKKGRAECKKNCTKKQDTNGIQK